MIKRIVLAALLLTMALALPKDSYAQFHSPSNIVGAHLISPSDEDLKEACRMVAPWGWVVLVAREDEYSVEKLQSLHNIARDEKCLIFHRLATHFDSQNNAWARPSQETTNKIVNLCKNIVPSSKYFYLTLGNEVNRADEFGGAVDPKVYAQWAQKAKEALSQECSNVVITFSALDKAAPDSGTSFMSASRFYREMIDTVPSIFDGIQAIATHDYPPNMNGSCLTSGQRSIVGYQWEKNLLKSLGVEQADSLKIFITESGWRIGSGGVSESEAAQDTSCAYTTVGNDPSVMMRSHFAYKFCGEPFAAFSTIDCATNTQNAVGQTIQDFPKKSSQPEHEYKATTMAELVKNIVEDQKRTFNIRIVNKSTDNFRRGEYQLALLGSGFDYSFSDFAMVRPNETLETKFNFNPGKTSGCPTMSVGLLRNKNVVLELFNWQVCVHKPPRFTLTNIKSPLGVVDNVSAEAQFFDENEHLVTRHKETIRYGDLVINGVENVNFDNVYRGVLLIPGSLPQQWYVQFKPGENIQEARTVWPIDRNEDGKFSLNDILNIYSQ